MPRLEGELTALSFCWTVERRDGAGIALTSHDRDVRIGGTLCLTTPGLMPNAVQDGSLDQPLAELVCSLDSAALSASDLQCGRWDGARATLIAADWQTETAFVELCRGEIGEVDVEGDQFTVDFQGPSRHLSRSVCPATSPDCRAALGDKACRVDLADRSVRAKVVSADGATLTLDRELGAKFTLGDLRWMSGLNCALQTQVVHVGGAAVQLRQTPSRRVAIGDVVKLTEGCDKRLQTCRDRFANVVNFRGEPHLPGTDFLTRYPGV
ncbi:DUF2163 domain-containing protein [Sphingomonas arvum]|uniref:DUF2163 domain-containing protein n=1 Tax=Sphingomonas arvum TaxID=2992113 RepID=UPI0038B3D91C